MKEATGEIYDCIVVDCPYCQKEVHETWGRISDLTMSDPDNSMPLDCPHCKKEFICNIESSTGF